MKNLFKKLVLIGLGVSLFSSCIFIDPINKKEYGILKSAVQSSTDVVAGEYGTQIPNDFHGDQFMKLVSNKIPADYRDALKKFKIEVEPHGWYYLLKAFDGDAMILFDYSCSTQIDGPVIDNPDAFDLTRLDNYYSINLSRCH